MPATLAPERDRLDYLRREAEARAQADVLLFGHLRAYSDVGAILPWPMVLRLLVMQAEAN